jgi:hypothetical protein
MQPVDSSAMASSSPAHRASGGSARIVLLSWCLRIGGLDFRVGPPFGTRLAEAYERLLLDRMLGVFTRVSFVGKPEYQPRSASISSHTSPSPHAHSRLPAHNPCNRFSLQYPYAEGDFAYF